MKNYIIAVSVSTGSCNACTDVTKWLSCIVDNVGTRFWKERRMQQIFFAISLVLLYQVWSFVFKLPIMTQTVRPSSVATIKGGSGGSTGAGAPVTLSPDPPVAPPTGSLHQLYTDRFPAVCCAEGKGQNCWNCKYCFKSHLSLVWMRDLPFFPGLCAPLKKARPNLAPLLKRV